MSKQSSSLTFPQNSKHEVPIPRSSVSLCPYKNQLFVQYDLTFYILVKVRVLVAQWSPDSATPWTIAHHGIFMEISMEFSRHEYQSGLPFPSPEDFPDPGIKPGSPTLQADSLSSEPPGKPITDNKYFQLFINNKTVNGVNTQWHY